VVILDPVTGATEEYDGISWSTSPGSLNTGRGNLAGAGTQTAALAFGGVTVPSSYQDATEEYNGATWTSNPTGLNTARQDIAGCGTQTAALGFGGDKGGSPFTTGATEEYDGTSWTTSPASMSAASKIWISRSRYTNSWFSYWWL
jgi:hypothetical protein